VGNPLLSFYIYLQILKVNHGLMFFTGDVLSISLFSVDKKYTIKAAERIIKCQMEKD
jgi:hypothetical protein